jgi:hypothetical protein
VELNLDCNRTFPQNQAAPFTSEWSLTMLSKMQNLESCDLRLEPARIVASHASHASEVKLENIKSFDTSHHEHQIPTLFSKLTLPETAKIKISTTLTDCEDTSALARLVFPPKWPTSEQAWKQRKLTLHVSCRSVTYRIGDNRAVTVMHLGAQSSAPFVISSHGNPEGTLKEVEVNFAHGLEGLSPRWWDAILVRNQELESLVCSGGKVQDLCDSLGHLGAEGYKKCPKLLRLEIRDIDFAVEGAVSALIQMLDNRQELGCPIETLSVTEHLGSEELSKVRQHVEFVEVRMQWMSGPLVQCIWFI